MFAEYLAGFAIVLSVAALLVSLRTAGMVKKSRAPHFVDFGKKKEEAPPVKPNATFADAKTFRKLMGVPEPAPSPAGVGDLRQNLRLKFLHHEEQVDAAIKFERERNPTADLDTLMRAAIARWERDNK